MNAETLEALQGSIAKWEAIVAGTGEDLLCKNCTLCQAFYGCEGCPVMEATGQADCQESPWVEWFDCIPHGEKRIANTPERKKLAQAELDFLRSLLPAEDVK